MAFRDVIEKGEPKQLLVDQPQTLGGTEARFLMCDDTTGEIRVFRSDERDRLIRANRDRDLQTKRGRERPGTLR